MLAYTAVEHVLPNFFILKLKITLTALITGQHTILGTYQAEITPPTIWFR